MITIKNKKKNIEIEIDNKHDDVTFEPKNYEEKPVLKITIDKFDFDTHKEVCNDCKTFHNDFGSDDLNWILVFDDKSYRLDLTSFKNNIYGEGLYQRELSDNFNGTRFVFKIHHLPINIKELKILLEEAIEIENYEKCAQIRDLLIQ